MKSVILAIVAIISGLLLAACKKGGIQAEVDSAVAQGQYQFIALLNTDGKWTYPQVPGIPEWYFQTTGISIKPTKAETLEADLAYMKSYNEALYQTLKAQSKFHLIEENVAKIKSNLDKQQKSK